MADTFQTVNGPKTVEQMNSELRAAGWQGPIDGTGGAGETANVYASTTGGNVTPLQNQAGGPPAGGGSSTTTAAGGNTYNINPADMAKLQNFFGQSAGFSREQLAESARQFNATLAQKEAEWTRDGLPRLEIAQRLAALEDEKFRADLALAQKTQEQSNAIAVAGQTGVYNAPGTPATYQAVNASQFANTDKATQDLYNQFSGANAANKWAEDVNKELQKQASAAFATAPAGQGVETLASRQQTFAQDLARSQLGLDYLKTSASLGGPADYFQSADFNRGAAQRGDVPMFLSSLSSNTQMPSFTSAGAVGATPQTASSLAGGLTGTGTTAGGYNPDAALSQISSIFKKGPTGMAVGSLERLDPNETALMQSGAKKLGIDWEAWNRSYAKSGVGQGSFAA